MVIGTCIFLLALAIYTFVKFGFKWYGLVTLIAGIWASIYFTIEYFNDKAKKEETQKLIDSNKLQFNKLIDDVDNAEDFLPPRKAEIKENIRKIQNKINTYNYQKKKFISPDEAFDEALNYYEKVKRENKKGDIPASQTPLKTCRKVTQPCSYKSNQYDTSINTYCSDSANHINTAYPNSKRIMHTKVVGVTYNNRQTTISKLCSGDTLYFKREPDNIHDNYAVLVVNNKNEDVGYISKNINKRISDNIKNGLHYIVHVSAITGGGHYNNYGLNIEYYIS